MTPARDIPHLLHVFSTFVPAGPELRTVALIEALGDGDEWVRRHASVSIAQLAPSMNGELDALFPALDDENRYVRANTMFALQRSGSARAQERLIEELTLARWCPTTTRETTF